MGNYERLLKEVGRLTRVVSNMDERYNARLAELEARVELILMSLPTDTAEEIMDTAEGVLDEIRNITRANDRSRS